MAGVMVGHPVTPYFYDGVVFDPILLMILLGLVLKIGLEEYKKEDAKKQYLLYLSDLKKAKDVLSLK